MQKDVLLGVCALITAAAIVVAVNSFEKQNKLTKALQEERYSRMVAEESSQKSAAKVAVLENDLKSSQDKMTKIKDILSQEKNVNSNLKSQYEKLAQTKANLEAKLKTALEEQKAAQAAQQQPAPEQQASAVTAAPAPVGTN